MNFIGRVRAGLRLGVFGIGSWGVVASGIFSVLSPLPERWRRTCPYIARWARLGAWALGVKARIVGELPKPGSLVVCNHQGYVDVVTVGGLLPCIFAARHDMRAWPLFGALAASGSTIFINRVNKKAGFRGIEQVTAALGVGATIIGFPEGTSTDGTGLLPFRGGLFQAAVDANAPVVPTRVRYLTLDGQPITPENREVVAWYQGEPFFFHLMRMAARHGVEAEVVFGEPILPPHSDRRTLALAAEERIRALLGLGAERFSSSQGEDHT